MNNFNNNEIEKEFNLLLQIQNLSVDILNIIYNYMTGNAKFICNRKYDFLEKKIIKSNNYLEFWNLLKFIFEKMEKIKLINYITKIIIPSYPLIVNKIWYYSKENNKFFSGINLILLWKNNNIDILYYCNNRTSFDNNIIVRFIDAIYYYVFRSIQVFLNKKKISINKEYSNYNECLSIFNNIDKIHSLYKSIIFIYQNIKKIN
jgi:hypothetical protein